MSKNKAYIPISIVLISFALLIAILIGLIWGVNKIGGLRGGYQKNTSVITYDADSDSEFLSETTGIDIDCAEGVIDELNKVGASRLRKIKSTKDSNGYTIYITDADSNVYCVCLGELGYLDVIYDKSPNGKILYAGVDDM